LSFFATEYYDHHITRIAVKIAGWLVVLAAAALTVLGMLVAR